MKDKNIVLIGMPGAGKSTIGVLLAKNIEILETDFENHVIATGGSVVYSEKSMEHLKKNGLTVYLNHTLETIEKRIIFEIIFFIKFLIFFNIF